MICKECKWFKECLDTEELRLTYQNEEGCECSECDRFENFDDCPYLTCEKGEWRNQEL